MNLHLQRQRLGNDVGVQGEILGAHADEPALIGLLRRGGGSSESSSLSERSDRRALAGAATGR